MSSCYLVEKGELFEVRVALSKIATKNCLGCHQMIEGFLRDEEAFYRTHVDKHLTETLINPLRLVFKCRTCGHEVIEVRMKPCI